MKPVHRELMIWLGGAALVLVALGVYLVLSAPEPDVLPEIYPVL